MESQPVFDAFVVWASGPFKELHEWVSSGQGYMYPTDDSQGSSRGYVMIFPRGKRPQLPVGSTDIQIISIQQVGPP
jgi:hypothetical protein